jgi:membrane fusion protein, multidrug efflux system
MLDPRSPVFSRSKLWIGSIILGLVAAYVLAQGLLARTADNLQLKELADKQSVRTVKVITPALSPASPSMDLPGRIEAFSKAPLYARISGYLKTWKADIGTPVRAGQLLAEIDTPDVDQQILQAKAELAISQANAALSENTAKRWQSLQTTGFVSAQAVEEKMGDLRAKQAMVNASQANVNRLQAMKSFSRINAPFDGVVTARNTDIGALVNVGGAAGSELFVVSDVRRLRLYVQVPQNQVTAIRTGSQATFTVPEKPGKVFTAKVQSMAQAIQASSGSMLVQLFADNQRGELLPGGFAQVSFDMPAQTEHLNIPPSALIFSKTGLQVATVNADNKVVIKPVLVAKDHGIRIELLSGLESTDRVIENPPDGVMPGDLVRVAATENTK